MKLRVLSGILALMLVLSGQTLVFAEQSNNNAAAIDLSGIKPYESAVSMCWVGDSLYILGTYGIYKLQRGESQPTTLVDLSASTQYQYMEQKPDDAEAAASWSHAIRFLFTDDESLFGLHPYSGEIFKITETGFENAAQLPADLINVEANGESFIREIKSITYSASSKRLFLLMGTDDYNEYEKTQLFAFDIVTQTATKCSPPGISAVVSADAGKLALYVTGENEAIWQYDIATDSLEQEMLPLKAGDSPSGMAWFSGKNALAHYTASRVALTSTAGEAQTKAYLPVSFVGYNTVAACSADGIYAYPYGNHVFLRDVSIEGEATQTVLRVLGYLSPNLQVAFSIQNPEVAVVTVESSADEYIQQAAITADSSVDVFVVSATDSYSNIKKKEFAAPLNSKAEMVAASKQLYPSIQEAIFDGENLIAFPLAFNPHSWTINETVWKELGLPQYPTTYDELFQAIFLWLDDYADDYPDYTLSDVQQGTLETLVTMLVKEYIFQVEKSEDRLTFDTPAFRDLMQSVIDNAYLLAEENEQWGMPLISANYQGFGITYNDSDIARMLLPPTINKEQAQLINASMELLVLNSASVQQEAALEFIAFCAANLNATTMYCINPNMNDPLRNANYESRLETLNQELETIESRLASADELQKKTIQEEIDQKKLMIERVADNEWSISDESIQAYRDVVEHLRIPYDSAFLGENMTGGFAAISEIIARFCADGLTTDELGTFIKALDQVTYMVYAEGH